MTTPQNEKVLTMMAQMSPAFRAVPYRALRAARTPVIARNASVRFLASTAVPYRALRAARTPVIARGNASVRFLASTTSSSRQGKGESPQFNSIWWPILGGLAVATAGGVKYVHDHLGGTEGLYRSVSFYNLAIPKYIEYRYHMYMQSPDAVWEELDRETSARGLDKLMELKGFYVKCGQMCSANIGNAFPPVWQDTMSVLQDQVPPQPFHIVEEIVKSELDFDKVFSSFEETPIGSAAIGQVHRATLKDGTAVVVKVRYPDVERQLRGDVRTIKMFARVAQPVHVPALEEIEKQFMTEFDYVQEGKQLDEVRLNLTKAGLAGPGKLCRVPKAYLQYCTQRVLVMEELKGDKLAVGLKQEMKVQASREGKTVDVFYKEMKDKEREAMKKGEELKGPSAEEYNLYISLLDKKRRFSNTVSRLHNWSLAFLPGKQSKEIKDRSDLPVNHAKMIDDLLHIHGHEVLVDGVFNGDPHPGNILLVREGDGSPAIGLIDYGQVKRLTKETRHDFAKLIIALDEDNKDDIFLLTKELGFKTKNMNPEIFYLWSKVSFDQDNHQILGGKHVQLFMEDLEARDPVQGLPRDLLMVSRASILLRGLGHALHQSRSVAKAWRPIAERVLREDI